METVEKEPESSKTVYRNEELQTENKISDSQLVKVFFTDTAGSSYKSSEKGDMSKIKNLCTFCGKDYGENNMIQSASCSLRLHYEFTELARYIFNKF